MKIGFLGCGNMGGALARAARRADSRFEILLNDASPEKGRALAEQIGAECVPADRLFAEAELLFLGLKPQVLPAALSALSAEIATSHAVFVSMAAGVSLAALATYLPGKPCIRIMPNTPVEVGAGMTVYAANREAGEEAVAAFLAAMAASGRCLLLPEEQIDAACAVSGCGPAFVYLFADALASGGSACGLSRETALALATETLSGAAQMIRETKREPEALKNAVCSPGGSTLAGVAALLEGGFPQTAEAAVAASFRRTKELAGK